MRKRINEIIEPSKEGDKASLAYDIMMLLAITVSIIPLMFVEDNKLFRITEAVTVTIFIIDYILRWITADCRLQKKEMSFALYPWLLLAKKDNQADEDPPAFQVHPVFQ